MLTNYDVITNYRFEEVKIFLAYIFRGHFRHLGTMQQPQPLNLQ